MASPPAETPAGWRSALGETSLVWAGTEPRHGVDEDSWFTVSGLASAEYNLAVAYGRPATGDSAVERCRGVLEEAGSPALLAVTGAGLGEVGRLVDGDWVCVRAAPVMVTELSASPGPGGARLLHDDDGLARLRATVALAFGLDGEAACYAVPGAAGLARAGWHGVGLEVGGELVAGGLCCRAGSYACIWSMATHPAHRRKGYGRLVLETMLAQALADGARHAALLASREGSWLYASCGFRTVEHWQLWSRPGWVLI